MYVLLCHCTSQETFAVAGVLCGIFGLYPQVRVASRVVLWRCQCWGIVLLAPL